MMDIINNTPWMYVSSRIILYFAIAWMLALVIKTLIRLFTMKWKIFPSSRKPNPQRQETLRILLIHAINLLAIVAAGIACLGLFIQADTIAWMIGLFSAAFGFGARPLISDYLAGLSFIFEDTFSVGEKIEIQTTPSLEGVVEEIKLKTTKLRALSGELYIVPNGEIRAIRNFSRGRFSNSTISINILSTDLSKTIAVLEKLNEDSVSLIPNLIEPWKVISTSGEIGHDTELTVIAKARYGKAAEMTPRLIAFIQEKLNEENISLVD